MVSISTPRIDESSAAPDGSAVDVGGVMAEAVKFEVEAESSGTAVRAVEIEIPAAVDAETKRLRAALAMLA